MYPARSSQAALVLSILLNLLCIAADDTRPNIILVMADDQGWGQTGYYGHPVLKTPNLDAMSKTSLVFNRFYAAAPVCSPTRGSVLTGRHPFRIKITNHGRYVTCGAIGGAMVEIDMRRIYLKNLDILGSSQGTRADFERVLDYILSGSIKPLLAGTYPLKDLARAQADFQKKNFVGKLVIEVNAPSA